MKQSIITAFLGRTQDRFSEYQQVTELHERLSIVQQIDGVTMPILKKKQSGYQVPCLDLIRHFEQTRLT